MLSYSQLQISLLTRCPRLCVRKLYSLFTRQQLSQTRYHVLISPQVMNSMQGSLYHPSFLPPLNSFTYFSSGTKNNESESDFQTDGALKRTKKGIMTNPLRPDWMNSQTMFREVIMEKTDTSWTDSDWHQIAEKLSSVSGRWEVLCMQTLYQDKNISLGRNLMKYLQKQPEAPSLVVQTYYIGLLGETSANSPDQEMETKAYYDSLVSQTDILDAATIEVLNSGLSNTRFYHECLKLIEICKETSKPGPALLIKILRAGLRSQDSDVCTFILSELEEACEPTSFNAFASQVVEECLAAENMNGLEMIMNFVKKHSILLPRNALDEIAESFYRHQPNHWMGKYGYIHHRHGHCVVCGHQMNRINVGDDEFQSIQKAFLNQVIVGTNIFYKSTPEEVQSFVNFVERKAPFDVVIDGLNVMHKGPKGPQRERLEIAVKHFNALGRKVLVLGSVTMTRFTTNLKQMKPRPEVYLTSTTRADDAFFLYAALCSGKDTLILSHDKLRDHKFHLDPSIRHIFHKWLLSAQVYDWFISRNNQFVIGRRHLFDIGPVKDEDGWHIPENDIDKSNPFGNFSVLCLRDTTKQTVPTRSVTGGSQPYERGLSKGAFRERQGKRPKKTRFSKGDVKEWFEN